MHSITCITHPHKDKKGRQRLQIRVIYKRARVYLKTDFKTGNGHPTINAIIKKQMTEAENKLLDAMRDGLTEQGFKKLFKQEKAKSIRLEDYVTTLRQRLKGKLSDETLKHYKSVAKKLGDVTLSEISVTWLERFERGLALDGNTVNANMKQIKGILYKAEKEGLIKLEQFEDYKVPGYKQKIPEYLTEKEIHDFTEVVRIQTIHGRKVAGWYFLLSCYTGWRISDSKSFDPSLIKYDSLILRAKKNGQVVSMPIVTRLKEVLKFVVKNKFSISEQSARDYVRDMCADAGINRHIKFHSARHSFAMLLRSHGFDREEIAEKLGDSKEVAAVYDRILNEPLNDKIRKKLG